MTQTVQLRGSGRTTKQMREAPHGALFIWCNDSLDWPRRHAREQYRPDLTIAGPSALVSVTGAAQAIRGRVFSAVILDHSLADQGLDPEQHAGWERLQSMVRAPAEAGA